MELSRVLLAWERVLRAGGTAPRTTWLHGVKVRAWASIPYFRANLATKCPGMRLQTCARTQNFDLVAGCLFFTRPILSGIDLQPPPFSPQAMGCLWIGLAKPSMELSKPLPVLAGSRAGFTAPITTRGRALADGIAVGIAGERRTPRLESAFVLLESRPFLPVRSIAARGCGRRMAGVVWAEKGMAAWMWSAKDF